MPKIIHWKLFEFQAYKISSKWKLNFSTINSLKFNRFGLFARFKWRIFRIFNLFWYWTAKTLTIFVDEAKKKREQWEFVTYLTHLWIKWKRVARCANYSSSYVLNCWAVVSDRENANRWLFSIYQNHTHSPFISYHSWSSTTTAQGNKLRSKFPFIYFIGKFRVSLC